MTLDEQSLRWQEKSTDHHLICVEDADYPPLLKAIHNAPPLLFVKGRKELLKDPQLAMVGSRKMSAYGRDIAFSFAKELAQNGLIITSGLAIGIDGRAHEGALAANGQTIAILGSGIDIIAPLQHTKLAAQIAENGCLVSCFPLGTHADKSTFPQRNRIITGLSLGTLVIEAALQSGSLISARLAMEQGREVFAIPGSIHNPQSRGCHLLLQQGAKLVQSTADILEELKMPLQHRLSLPDTAQPPVTKTPLDAEAQHVLKSLSTDAQPFDVIMAHTQLSAAALSSLLLRLELEDHVERTDTGYRRMT